MDDLRRGAEVDVDDPDDAVATATVFLPDELRSYEASQDELASQGVAVVQPGEVGHDVVILYRAGPYCGVLPSVAARVDGQVLHVTVQSRRGGSCDDTEYDEAIGLRLNHDGAREVQAVHR
jgi:hypothetical protein